MTLQQIEAWVLAIIELVKAGKLIEDSRVELKSDWPDAQKAARRLAAHANSARGESILWIVGLDEQRGVVPFRQTDFAEWIQRLQKEFDGLSPTIRELVVPTGNGTVIALFVDTSRVPYVVRNPNFGSPQGGAIQLEVPWREGTSVRSARREDLLRILVPIQKLPILEVLSASVTLNSEPGVAPAYQNQVPAVRHQPHLYWQTALTVYMTPATNDRVVLPFHKAGVLLRSVSQAIEIRTNDFQMRAPSVFSIKGSKPDSHTILATQSEAILDGPGTVHIEAIFAEVPRDVPSENLLVTLSLVPAGNDQALTAKIVLSETQSEQSNRRRWAWVANDAF